MSTNGDMTRRDLLKVLGMGTASMALAGTVPLRAAAGTDRPNVLMIVSDDLNDWIGCLGGHPDAVTPNIDRLAARCVNFTNTYCAAPACNPSRAALFTGLRPSTTGVYRNQDDWRPVLPDVVTMPDYFKAQGYRTMGGGKLFHGPYPDEDAWDEYYPKQAEPNPAGKPLNGIPNTGNLDWGPIDRTTEEMPDWAQAVWAADKLGQTYDNPFFLAVGFYKPHLRWYAPQKYFDKFPPESVTIPEVPDNDLDDLPPAALAWANTAAHQRIVDADKWADGVAAYLATSNFVDDCVGHVLDAFENSAYADNTIVVFWTDHGWHLGEKKRWKKFTLWEEAARTPFFMSVPGVTTPGARCNWPVTLLDIYPTLVELCGLPERRDLEGVSLVPLLESPNRAWNRPALTTYKYNNHSLRTHRWRYTRYANGDEELYDHHNDPMEWTNLADQPEYADLKTELAQWFPKVNAPTGGPARDPTPLGPEPEYAPVANLIPISVLGAALALGGALRLIDRNESDP